MNPALRIAGALALSAGILLTLIAAALSAAQGQSKWKRDGDRILPTPSGIGTPLAYMARGLSDPRLLRLFLGALLVLGVGVALLWAGNRFHP